MEAQQSSGNASPQSSGPTFYIGQHESQRTAPLAPEILNQTLDIGYDFVTVPITTPAFHHRVYTTVSNHVSKERQPENEFANISDLTPEDSTLTPDDSNSSIIALTSSWIDLGSSNPVIAHVSRQVLELEVGYAAFCGINNIVLYGPLEGADHIQYARAVREALTLGPYIHLHVLLPMTGELEMDPVPNQLSELNMEDSIPEDDDDDDDLFNTWEAWNTIRKMCSHSQKLSIALELPRPLLSHQLQSRWYSEPVRILVYPRTTFLRNSKGYPVLSKPHQQLLSRFARLKFSPWLLLSDVDTIATELPTPTPAEAAASAPTQPQNDTPVQYLQYLRHLQDNQPPRPPIERFGQGYQDFLQSPLQPLTDNLESITYEVFEKDPIKYDWYERAIESALIDLQAEPEIGGGNPENLKTFVIAVVGAGRGPLVTRALRAAAQANVEVEVWAVEKNPNAFRLLQRRNANDREWGGKVNVVKSDMRTWPGPATFPPRTIVDTIGNTTINQQSGRVDILVSELLGSFADNELSPECLDGVAHVLHPTHGICIPQSYSAHMTPISTPRLHSDLISRSGNDKWDLPYVVLLQQHDYLSTVPSTSLTKKSESTPSPLVKECWSFNHHIPFPPLSRQSLNMHNTRSTRLTFPRSTADGPGICHGLAGYFETVLYSSRQKSDEKVLPIELSTNPVTIDAKSEGMISWFPCFFPLRTPLVVPEGAEVVVYMWRKTDGRGVWYEWIVEVWEGGESVKKGDDVKMEDSGEEEGSEGRNEDNGMNKRRRRRRKVAMSELGTSRENACLI